MTNQATELTITPDVNIETLLTCFDDDVAEQLELVQACSIKPGELKLDTESIVTIEDHEVHLNGVMVYDGIDVPDTRFEIYRAFIDILDRLKLNIR